MNEYVYTNDNRLCRVLGYTQDGDVELKVVAGKDRLKCITVPIDSVRPIERWKLDEKEILNAYRG